MARNNTKNSKLKLLPIILVLAVVPFVMYYYAYPTNLEGYDWQAATLIYSVDIFLYGKGFVLCLTALLMVGLFFYTRQQRKELKNETIPLLMYTILIVFSTLCSKYRYFSVHGCQDQFESVWVLFAYLITAVYTMYILDEERNIRTAMYALLIGGAVMAVLGILQLLKLDPFRTDLFAKLLLLGTGQDTMTFTVAEGTVYTTLFNQNYVGAYACILIPCAVGFAIAAKKKWMKILCLILVGALLVCIFGANAKNGVIALFLCAILMVVIYRKELLRNIRKLILALVIAIAAIIAVNFASGNLITNTFINIYNNLIASATPTEQRLVDVITGDDELELVLSDESLHIQYQVNADGTVFFGIKDTEGNEIMYQQNSTMVDLMDARFSDIKLEPCMIDDDYAFTVYIDDLTWNFSNQVKDGTFYFYNFAHKWVKLEKADSAVFTDCTQLFSGRGYIWAKTIPLLKNYIFIGSGPDTFQLVFPQYDYVDLTYKFGPNLLITRAHNMYLQMAVQTGVISLICFLVFYGMYFYKCCKIYIKRKKQTGETWLFHAGAGIFVGSFGYMLSGIVNDSLPVTAPIFWCIMGIGIAVNTMLSRSCKANETSTKTEPKRIDA